MQVARSPSIDAKNLEGQDEEAPACSSEDYSQEEQAMDLPALAEVICHRCNKKGRFARNCKIPAAIGRKGAGKARTRFLDSYGTAGAHNLCKWCNKLGHSPEKCWKLYPELIPLKYQNQKKAQGVDDEEGTAASPQQ